MDPPRMAENEKKDQNQYFSSNISTRNEERERNERFKMMTNLLRMCFFSSIVVFTRSKFPTVDSFLYIYLKGKRCLVGVRLNCVLAAFFPVNTSCFFVIFARERARRTDRKRWKNRRTGKERWSYRRATFEMFASLNARHRIHVFQVAQLRLLFIHSYDAFGRESGQIHPLRDFFRRTREREREE